MKEKARKYWIGLFAGIAAMFAWIFAAVALTGGRDVADFTETDQIIMTIFIVVEIFTIIVTMCLAVLAGRAQGRINLQRAAAAQANSPRRNKQGTGLLVLSFVVTFAVYIGGIVLGERFSPEMRETAMVAMGNSAVLAVALVLISIGLNFAVKAYFKGQKIAKMQRFFHSHREQAEKVAARKLRFLGFWRFATALYLGVLGMAGLTLALCAGIKGGTNHVVYYCAPAVILLMCTLSRVRFPASQEIFESNLYVAKEDYPQLYALAEKAKKEMNCKGEIRIALQADCNAGIAKIGKIYSVQLGALLLGIMSETELYSILLHEFAHETKENKKSLAAGDYYNWIQNEQATHFYSGLTNLVDAFWDNMYCLQYTLYKYASDLQREGSADRAMLRCGDPEAVASALLKIHGYHLMDWEWGTEDSLSEYESETPDEHRLSRELDRFRTALEKNHQRWQALVQKEIQSRASTHPTCKQRLESLGITDGRVILAEQTGDYARDCRKAAEYIDSLILESVREEYDKRREVYYLKPKAQVEAWELAGKPVIAEEYGDVVWSLRQLGRNLEAIELCDRAIRELPMPAACDAYYIRGNYRLHSYDSAGVEDIYTAIENNSNYLDEGISTIGTFCCLTGNAEELERYRQRAVELAQNYEDTHRNIETLTPKDQLSAEKLPDGLLEAILEHILSVDGGALERIYLVRKTVTEDFFASVFVLEFAQNTQDDVREEIIHKMFRYLDTCSDWQFALFDLQNVADVPLQRIPGSCVYRKEEKTDEGV